MTAGIDLDKEKGKCPRCSTVMQQTYYKNDKKVNVDICPKGCGLWLDGGEILSLRKRGLVNLADWFGHEIDFLKYIFSKNGFKSLKSRIRGKKNKK